MKSLNQITMKKYLSKKLLWQSLLSVMALGIFILLATGSLGSFGGPNVTLEKYGDGLYRETTLYATESYTYVTTYDGNRDEYGRWHGPIVIIKTYRIGAGSETESHSEQVNMVHGMRHGISITKNNLGIVIKKCWYFMGFQYHSEKKAALFNTEDSSAFQVLTSKFSWFLFTLNAFSYEDEYVEAFMDSLETVLGTNEFYYFDFDDYYANAIYDLEGTVYDSIIKINSMLSYYHGVVLLRNSELRMAVIDRYRSNGNSTFNIVNTTYPGYLLSINDAGVNDQDFEGFCQDLDSCMTSYGLLDLEDSFFVDSVDARMYRAISDIFSAKKSSSPADVANVVLTIIFQQFSQGDIIKRAVREAYFISQGIISVPTVTTEFSGGNSATSVTLHGYVIEDGGADVTSRGITWATYYNPTTDDNTEGSGTGMGEFTVTLDGLTEGAVYYARSYATNSTGTAYGNCISFIAQSTVGIEENIVFDQDLNIYPNPAHNLLTIQNNGEGLYFIELSSLNGQLIYSTRMEGTTHQIDLSSFEKGVYFITIRSKDSVTTRKIIKL